MEGDINPPAFETLHTFSVVQNVDFEKYLFRAPFERRLGRDFLSANWRQTRQGHVACKGQEFINDPALAKIKILSHSKC